MITREDGKSFRSPEDMRRYQLIERVGQILYGDKWQNKLRQDMGLSSGYMSQVTQGLIPVSDDALNRAIAGTKRARIDMRRRHALVVAAVQLIADELGSALIEDMGSFELDIVAGDYEAEMDRRVQSQVDAELARILPAVDAALEYPSADNLKQLAAVRDRYRPAPDPQPMPEMKP